MPVSSKIPAFSVAIMLAALTAVPAQAYNGATPEQKLQQLLQPHLYRGGHVTDDIRAATGDPNIPVIDWRKPGDISMCGYQYRTGRFQGRILFCE